MNRNDNRPKKSFIPTQHSPLASGTLRKRHLSQNESSLKKCQKSNDGVKRFKEASDDVAKPEPLLCDTRVQPNDNDDEEEDLPVLSSLFEVLQKCLFLGGAPKLFYSAIISNIKLVTHYPQQYIVRFGEPSKALYILLKGTVAVASPDGETVHAELQPSAYFGEIGVLFSRPRTATVISKTKTLLAIVTKETLDSILPNYPYIERSIRDEAQKRLSLQENKRSKKLSAQLNLSEPLEKRVKSDNTKGDVERDREIVTKHSKDTLGEKIDYNKNTFANDRERKKSIILPSIMNNNSSMNVSNVERRSGSTGGNTSQLNEVLSRDLLIDLFIPIRKFAETLGLLNIVPFNALYDFTVNSTKILYKNASEYIFRKGDMTREVYFVLEGKVDIVDSIEIFFERSELHGTKFEKILAELSQYEYFGEMAFVQHFAESKSIFVNNNGCDFKVRTADVRAATQVTLLVFPYNELKSFCEKYPAIFVGFREEASKRSNANKDFLAKQQTDPGMPKVMNNSSTSIENDDYVTSADINTNEKLSPMVSKNSLFSSDLDTPNKPPMMPIPLPLSEGIKWNSKFLSNSSNVYSSNGSIKSNSLSVDSLFSLKKRRSSIATTGILSDDNMAQPQYKQPFSGFKNENRAFAPRRRSAFELTNVRTGRSSAISRSSVALQAPSVNPLTPSLSNFPGQNHFPRQQPFQYLPLSQRLKYSCVNSRRRSSLLSYSPKLPDHLLLQVFKYLDLKTLMKLRAVSRRWRQMLYFSPELFKVLDLSFYHTAITDNLLTSIADFVGPRVSVLNISNCYHVTDKGFSYLINEIGMNGSLKVLKMRSMWHVSAMSIMDIAAPSVGRFLEEIDFSNCKKVRDEVIERLIGNNFHNGNQYNSSRENGNHLSLQSSLRDPINQSFGCYNLKRLNLSYCKCLTDKSMYCIANFMSDRLEYLNLKRCITITDKGFSYWQYKLFPNLKTLILSDCTFLTQSTISAITFAAPAIEELDLSFCCALDDNCLDILRVGCQKLRKLNLSFCGNAVSDNSLLSLSLSLTNLTLLILKGCIRVTRAGVDILLSGCCPLKYLDISQCKYAHVYPGGIEAVKLPVKAGTRSSFITTSPEKGIVEIVV